MWLPTRVDSFSDKIVLGLGYVREVLKTHSQGESLESHSHWCQEVQGERKTGGKTKTWVTFPLVAV